MPGIVGVIARGRRGQNQSELAQMLKCMMHEKFYTSGTLVDEGLGLAIGWVSLEGSFSDCMPVWNEKRDICLLFAGENFADSAEIAKLKARGHDFDPTDASYLVHMYEEAGLAFLESLNGWFCGMLADMREGQLVLFNDRHGLRRIYYHQNADGFYFASEAKSILKVLPETRRVDPASLGELLACGCVLQNRSLFPDVAIMPPASAWTFSSRGPIRKAVYFDKARWENQSPLGGEEYYEKLKATFQGILPRYFGGKAPLAVSLTGGVDTRLMMAWVPCPPFRLPCFTFSGMTRDSVDARIAGKVAAVCQQDHRVISVNRRFFAEFPALAKRAVYFTDGAMDVRGSVELFVNRLARETAPVRITGNYGDEILRGVVAFKPLSLCRDVFSGECDDLLHAARETYRKELLGRRLSFVAFKQVPWHHYARQALEQTQLTLRSPYLDNDLVALAFQAPADPVENARFALRLISDGNAELGRIATDRGRRLHPIPIITRITRLYREVTFKAEYMYDSGMPQWMARVDRVAGPLHIERLFLGRHKFYHFRTWYRHELSDYVKDVLLDPRTRNRPYLRGDRLEVMVKSHMRGDRNFTEEIHRILSSELIQRLLIEQR